MVIQLGPKTYIELIVTMHACMSIIDEAEAGTGAGMATSSISWPDGPGGRWLARGGQANHACMLDNDGDDNTPKNRIHHERR